MIFSFIHFLSFRKVLSISKKIQFYENAEEQKENDDIFFVSRKHSSSGSKNSASVGAQETSDEDNISNTTARSSNVGS